MLTAAFICGGSSLSEIANSVKLRSGCPMGLSQRVEFGFGFLCREKRLLLSIFAPIVFGVQIPSDFSQRIQTINTSYEVEADLPICRGGLKRRCVAEIWS